MNDKHFIRGFKEEYKLLRNVSNPIIILGLPLKLAFFYMGAIVVAVLLVLILTTIKLPFYITLGVPGILVALAIGGIKVFFTRYGINGFYQQRRDNNLPTAIEADMSVEQILKNKITK